MITIIYRVDEKSTLLCYNIDVEKGVDPNERKQNKYKLLELDLSNPF